MQEAGCAALCDCKTTAAEVCHRCHDLTSSTHWPRGCGTRSCTDSTFGAPKETQGCHHLDPSRSSCHPGITGAPALTLKVLPGQDSRQKEVPFSLGEARGQREGR